MNAPSLAVLPQWYIERQLRYFKQGIRGAQEGDSYGQQMAAMANTLVDEAAIRNVSSYIVSLESGPAPPTLEGDPHRGASYFNSCGACHGVNAMGNFALQAPRLAGQDDWYLKRQLQNFRTGIRGVHQGDNYGHQMVLMARSLQDEQTVNDLLAYLNTLASTDRGEL
jgi:cytochrome c oxidase subunit 2